jgi:oligopeptide transport system substrate-binding protein
MIRKALIACILVSAFSACNTAKQEGESGISASSVGGGGTLHLNETENYQTLYPYAVTDVISANIAYQIYEGLVQLDPKTLQVRPCLAEKWELDETGTSYTFHLRKDAHFQNDPCFTDSKGRNITAQDVKYSFEMLCSQSNDNFSFATTFKDRVLGANKFYDASAKGKPTFDLEGIKVIDDHTVQIKLEKPSLSFLEILAAPSAVIVAKEAVEQYGNMMRIGSGPFRYIDNKKDNRIILVRNENYYRKDSSGKQLPYLDTIVISFMPTKKAELDAFIAGKLDMVFGLPSESINDFLANQIAEFEKNPPKYILERSPDMATQFYEFNLTKAPLKDVRVRQAISYAIDREKLVTDILKNEAYGPGQSGVTPPSFSGYDINKIIGFDYNPTRAKKLLAEAGFPDGKNFPILKLELNSGGSKHTNVAFEIQKQLQDVLGINIELEVVSLPKKLEDSKYARADIFRSGWVADYPSPENFLLLFYGKIVPASLDQPSFPNIPRYKNAEFDKLYDLGKMARTKEESYKYYMQAEQLAIKDAPLLVLWYDESYKLMQSKVKNFKINPLNYRSYAEVYIDNNPAPVAKDTTSHK